ncbi:hypothetical protein TNCV_3598531 [Trichonephila clavipes]|nr:hypothetical protein TNCV_3598531 [Trichonephila clavipes]
MLLLLSPSDRHCLIEVHEIHHVRRLDCTPVVSHRFEHHTGNNIIWLGSTSILRENPWGSQRNPTSFSSTNISRLLAARRLFGVPPCHEGTEHLQKYVPSSRFEPRPYDTIISVTKCRMRDSISCDSRMITVVDRYRFTDFGFQVLVLFKTCHFSEIIPIKSLLIQNLQECVVWNFGE